MEVLLPSHCNKPAMIAPCCSRVKFLHVRLVGILSNGRGWSNPHLWRASLPGEQLPEHRNAWCWHSRHCLRLPVAFGAVCRPMLWRSTASAVRPDHYRSTLSTTATLGFVLRSVCAGITDRAHADTFNVVRGAKAWLQCRVHIAFSVGHNNIVVRQTPPRP